jgi:hypothetical protein
MTDLKKSSAMRFPQPFAFLPFSLVPSIAIAASYIMIFFIAFSFSFFLLTSH